MNIDKQPVRSDNFMLSCFALTALGIFQFFLTWYAFHYNECIKSPLLIILGFAVYILCVGIFYLQSIIKDKNETINKMLNRNNILEMFQQPQRLSDGQSYEIPQWLKDMQDEKMVNDSIQEVLKNADTHQNVRYSPSTGKILLSKEERSRKCREGAVKRWKREREQKEVITRQSERENMLKMRGSKGGKKSWESLTPEQRKLRAQNAVKARWKNHKKGE